MCIQVLWCNIQFGYICKDHSFLIQMKIHKTFQTSWNIFRVVSWKYSPLQHGILKSLYFYFSITAYKRNQIGYTLFFLHFKHQETIFLLTTWCQTKITTSWSRTKLIMAIVCVLSQLQIQQFQRYYRLVIDSYHNPTQLL